MLDSVMREYECSSNKEQFLSDRQDQFRDIQLVCCIPSILPIFLINLFLTARTRLSRLAEKDGIRTQKRAKGCSAGARQQVSTCFFIVTLLISSWHSILERLKQLGYEREINYFGRDCFREPRKKSPKPLTDKGQLSPNEIALYPNLIVDMIEWTRMLPKWLETMNHYRHLRLDAVVWHARRRSLQSEYNIYVRQRSSDVPSFDLLPHVIDLARFPPFRDIIEAPEGAQMDEKPFASAFSQLPALADEWRKPLDAELAELVKIPPHLSLKDASQDLGVASNSTTRAEVLQAGSDKLRLACALFTADAGVVTHSEVFSTCLLNYPYPERNANASSRTGSIENRFGIHFLTEAPYIVHACGLDPNIATVEDMDRRNARLRCLACKPPNNIVMNWRDAVCFLLAREELFTRPSVDNVEC